MPNTLKQELVDILEKDVEYGAAKQDERIDYRGDSWMQ